MPAPKPMLVAAALALAASWAGGQTVYRCGNSYSQQPCPGGTAVDVSDPRTRADAVRAGKATAADVKRADMLAKERAEEAKNAPKAIVIGPATSVAAKDKPAEDAKEKKKKKGAESEPFTAVAPKAPGEAKKAKP
jgi:hypothetical protein